jgi:hypothetical protein
MPSLDTLAILLATDQVAVLPVHPFRLLKSSAVLVAPAQAAVAISPHINKQIIIIE